MNPLNNSYAAVDAVTSDIHQEMQTMSLSDQPTLLPSGIPAKFAFRCELPHGDVVCAVTISKNNNVVYTGGKGNVKVWDISNRLAESPKTPIVSLECLESQYIRSCKLFPDDRTLAVSGEASSILLWDVETQQIRSKMDSGTVACYALALSPDSNVMFACCADGNVQLWDVHNKEKIASLPGHVDGASCIDVARDGTTLWTGGLDNTVRSWDLRERQSLTKHEFDSQIFSLGCCPTDDWVAVGMENNTVEVISIKYPEQRHCLYQHKSCVLSLKYAHSGSWFLSTGKDDMFTAWKSSCGASRSLFYEFSPILSCDISSDDSILVTGSGEKKATVYDVILEN